MFGALLLCIAACERADAAPKPQQGDHCTDGVTLAGGRMIPELMFRYRTVGMSTQDDTGLITKAILLLHGAASCAPDLLADDSADILFASSRSLDASQYFLMFPEPNDTLDEPVELVPMQYRLALEHFAMNHLRRIPGNGEAGQLQPANQDQLSAAPGPFGRTP